jgi:hypothetical protein
LVYYNGCYNELNLLCLNNLILQDSNLSFTPKVTISMAYCKVLWFHSKLSIYGRGSLESSRDYPWRWALMKSTMWDYPWEPESSSSQPAANRIRVRLSMMMAVDAVEAHLRVQSHLTWIKILVAISHESITVLWIWKLLLGSFSK